MGSTEPALSYILHALRAGKNVVTANKEVLAKHAKELSAALAQGRGGLYFEASVAGGIPIIKALRGVFGREPGASFDGDH